jgi:hypothetical protein
MTNPTPHVLRLPGKGKTIAVVGDIYRFLATGVDANGKYAMRETIVPLGMGCVPVSLGGVRSSSIHGMSSASVNSVLF